jgi:hypothetical protein
MVMPALAILFWFFTAPDVRFGEGYFWAVGFMAASLGVYTYYRPRPSARSLKVLLLFFAVGSLLFPRSAIDDVTAVRCAERIAGIVHWSQPGINNSAAAGGRELAAARGLCRVVLSSTLALNIVTNPPAIFTGATLRAVEVTEFFTREGVRVFAGLRGGECWDAELPCAPSADPGLIIIVDEAGQPIGFRRGR